MIQDSTEIRLANKLRSKWSSKKTGAPITLHVLMDLLADKTVKVVMTDGKTNDLNSRVLPTAHDLAGALVLLDRGYQNLRYLNELAQAVLDLLSEPKPISIQQFSNVVSMVLVVADSKAVNYCIYERN